MNNNQLLILIGTILNTAVTLWYIAKRTIKCPSSDYNRGRQWACDLYYKQGYHIPYIENELERNRWDDDYDEFDTGAEMAIEELKRREDL